MNIRKRYLFTISSFLLIATLAASMWILQSLTLKSYDYIEYKDGVRFSARHGESYAAAHSELIGDGFLISIQIGDKHYDNDYWRSLNTKNPDNWIKYKTGEADYYYEDGAGVIRCYHHKEKLESLDISIIVNTIEQNVYVHYANKKSRLPATRSEIVEMFGNPK